MDNTQDAVIAFLSDPASHGGDLKSVERMETHGALVFLAGDEVFKIKRAVAFDYMDFSTLNKRRLVCEREFELNKLTAPTLYLGVVAITQDADGTLAIDGEGHPVEWAVHMRRFPQDKLFTSLARAHRLNHTTIKQLAAEIAEHHKRAPVSISADGTSAIGGIILELEEAFDALPGSVDPALTQRFVSKAKQRLEHCANTLDARARTGLIRRCHGDLHLGNIVLLNGKPVLFDALEFNESLATIDLLYEVAFLVMDLWHAGLRGQANLLLNRYLYETADLNQLEGLRALPVFMALRAGIRAMVAAQRAAQESNSKISPCKEAESFLRDAVGFLDPAPARLIAIGGLSGTGKSTLAAEIAAHVGPVPGAIHIRSDLERKTLFGAGETERLSEECYTPQASAQVYDVLSTKSSLVLEAGHAVIADAVFADNVHRLKIENLTLERDAPFTGLWLRASEEDLLSRVAARRGDASDATTDTVRTQLSKPRVETNWHEVDASGSPLETVIATQLVLRQDDALTFDDTADIEARGEPKRSERLTSD